MLALGLALESVSCGRQSVTSGCGSLPCAQLRQLQESLARPCMVCLMHAPGVYSLCIMCCAVRAKGAGSTQNRVARSTSNKLLLCAKQH